jgi:hypothetical protein
MSGIVHDRMVYLVVRSVALVTQLGALVCLTPLKQFRSHPEHIGGFVALSLIAWLLNLYSRQTGEYERRMLTRSLLSHKRQELALTVLVTVFALTSLVYLQMVPTWTILAISLSLGSCAGYALTHA